jgi:hypothetical protein
MRAVQDAAVRRPVATSPGAAHARKQAIPALVRSPASALTFLRPKSYPLSMSRADNTPDRSDHPASRRWLFVSAAAIVVVLLFARAMYRFFDLDEHQFVAPPILLDRGGLLPYLDYPYFHAPNLVFIYSAILWASPYKLFAARLVSVVCGAATIAILFGVGWRWLAGIDDRKRWLFAAGLTGSFMCARIFTYTNGWAWNHDAAVLAILVAYVTHLRLLQTRSTGGFLLVGLLCGLGAGIRLTVAPAAFPLGISLLLWNEVPWNRRLGAFAWFTLGGIIASLPSIVLFVMAPDRFLFGNLTYRELDRLIVRVVHNPQGTFVGKLVQLVVTYFSDPGNILIGAIAVFGLARFLLRGRKNRRVGPELLLLAMLGALFIGVVAPSPIYIQYHYIMFPFLLLACFAAIAADIADPVAIKRWGHVVGVGAAIVLITGLPRWYWSVVNLPWPSTWVPLQVHATGLWIDSRLPPGARVMTVDPLVVLEGGHDVYPQYATGRFVFRVGPFMNDADRRHFDMPWGPELAALLAREPPDALLYDVRLENKVKDFMLYAMGHAYVSEISPDGAYRLWIRPVTH